MSDLFLTPKEVTTLTGYRRPSSQIQQLRTQGLRFFVAADGYPRVPRGQIEAPGGSRAMHSEPDFTALG